MKLLIHTVSRGALLWCLALSSVHAGIATERLHSFFGGIQSLQGDFTQTTFDQHNRIRERTQGHFALQRPGKFRWDYTSPYHQLIVANGKKVWLYDEDLEQVTIKRLDEAVGNTPAQLLSSGNSLEHSFIINEIGNVDKLQWVELIPREKDTNFERMRLGFDEHDLRSMELMDSFGHTTRLEFSHLQHNPHLAASLFHFTPPPGVDVVGD